MFMSLGFHRAYAAEEQEVLIGMVYEFTGPGATSGWRYLEEHQLAIDEINQAGGILGRKITYFTIDTETKPAVSAAAMRKAVERNPFLVLGTVFSGSTIVNMSVLQKAGIPQITASQATAITQQGNDNIFRVEYSNDLLGKKFMKFIAENLKAKKMALIYVENDYGKSGRDAVIKYAKDYNIGTILDLPTTEGQADFTGELSRVKASDADVLYLYLNEDETVRAVTQKNMLGLKQNVVGSNPASVVAEKAGKSADGYMSFIGVSTLMPVFNEMSKAYERRFGRPPIKGYGYMTIYIIKEIVERNKKFDRQLFKDTLHNGTICVKDQPNVLLDVHYDDKGDVDRESAIDIVEQGKVKVLTTIGPFHPELFEKCKK